MALRKKVIVGMSGGVDSAVSAALLKEQGYDVTAIFMRNWDEQDKNGQCLASYDFADVEKVCQHLDIPYYTIDLVKEYWNEVFGHFLHEYERGRTPNPDILCNSKIKFKAFYQQAMKLGADYLATGHYCQLGPNYELLKGADSNKDQSYFLYAINPDVLKNVLFPVGSLLKSQVRDLAQKYQLPNATKKDSTGICFIGERNFPDFLKKYLKPTQGNFQNLNGKVVGQHQGSQFYTIGQRKGLGLGGEGAPWFVVGKDHLQNIVWVERGDDHPALYVDQIEVSDLNWLSLSGSIGNFENLKAKVRYRQQDQDCTIKQIATDRIEVNFKVPQRAVTLGQSFVLYSANKCLGGGIIDQIGKNYFEQKRELPVFF